MWSDLSLLNTISTLGIRCCRKEYASDSLYKNLFHFLVYLEINAPLS
jgi:hypothetical protein